MTVRRQPTTLLCDADGNLFPSEEPAFVASAVVTNQFLADNDVPTRLEPEELRHASTGRNFRATVTDLARIHEVELTGDVLEVWVAREKDAVTAHLARALRPDRSVGDPLRRLAPAYRLAVVSSSALTRVNACLDAAGLGPLFPPERRFSAEDSLPIPASKPDPAVYSLACERLEIEPGEGLAVEDSVPGVTSAVAAGVPTVGNVQFVPDAEQGARVEALRAAGALTVVGSWAELEQLLAAQ